jgi:hypothetical protein
MNEEKMIDVLADMEHGRPGVRHVQSMWFVREGVAEDCGTTACLAGWTVLQAGYVPVWSNGFLAHKVTMPGTLVTHNVGELAAEILNLNDHELDGLFFQARDLDDIYRRTARYMGVDEQVLRDKVQDRVTSL